MKTDYYILGIGSRPMFGISLSSKTSWNVDIITPFNKFLKKVSEWENNTMVPILELSFLDLHAEFHTFSLCDFGNAT